MIFTDVAKISFSLFDVFWIYVAESHLLNESLLYMFELISDTEL